MATQKGILPITGTLGGINFYFYKGKPVARKAGGGFTSKAIKTAPIMVRVRETSSEFGDCSRIKKVFKDGLFPYFGKRTDVALHGRMMQLFLELKDNDMVSSRGKRNVKEGLLSNRGKQLMKDFAFTVMPMPRMTIHYDTANFLLTIDDIDATSISYAHGATHLKIEFGLLLVDFDEPASKLFKSNAIFLENGSAPTSFTLLPISNVSGNGMRFAVLHYGFFQKVNGEMYPLKNGDSFGLRILEVDPD